MKTLIVILFLIPLSCFGQRYQDTNRGLYPNAIQLTINARNTALGIKYSHLFEKPFFGVPVGLYGSFSNTIKPDLRFINYDYERKVAIGGMITLPYNSLMHGIRTMLTVGAVRNIHPYLFSDNVLYRGQFDNTYYQTCKYGVDIGIQMQLKHFTTGITVDAINFLRYVEVSAGYTFYRFNP
jgi:hypothetical protein